MPLTSSCAFPITNGRSSLEVRHLYWRKVRSSVKVWCNDPLFTSQLCSNELPSAKLTDACSMTKEIVALFVFCGHMAIVAGRNRLLSLTTCSIHDLVYTLLLIDPRNLWIEPLKWLELIDVLLKCSVQPFTCLLLRSFVHQALLLEYKRMTICRTQF